MKFVAALLICSLTLSINSQAIDWWWMKRGDPKEVQKEELSKQIEDLKNENDTYKNGEIALKDEHETKIQIEKHKANESFKTASELQIKVLTLNEVLKLKGTETEEAIQKSADLEAKLKEFYHKLPRHILKKHGIPTDPGPDMLDRVKLALSFLIFSIFLCVILLAMSHSHRKGDFILWLNQKVWGKKLVSTISQYGIVFFCVYEIVANIPTVMFAVNSVRDWIARGS